MGLVGWGADFRLLEGNKHRALKLHTEGHKVLGPITPVPWLAHLAFALPWVQRGWFEFKSWATDELRRRLEVSFLAMHECCVLENFVLISIVQDKSGETDVSPCPQPFMHKYKFSQSWLGHWSPHCRSSEDRRHRAALASTCWQLHLDHISGKVNHDFAPICASADHLAWQQ